MRNKLIARNSKTCFSLLYLIFKVVTCWLGDISWLAYIKMIVTVQNDSPDLNLHGFIGEMLHCEGFHEIKWTQLHYVIWEHSVGLSIVLKSLPSWLSHPWPISLLFSLNYMSVDENADKIPLVSIGCYTQTTNSAPCLSHHLSPCDLQAVYWLKRSDHPTGCSCALLK